jgi:hypothetical protein
MNEEQRIKVLEEELKVLKNELKTVLLDLREQYLNIQNPFNNGMAANAGSPPPEINPKNGDDTNDSDNTDADELDMEGDNENDNTDIEFNQSSMAMDTDDFSNSPSLGDDSNDGNQFASAGPQFTELETTEISGPNIDGDSPESRPALSSKNEERDENEDGEDENDYLDEESESEVIALKSPSVKNNKKKALSLPTGNPKFDLVVIAGLTQWIDQATAKLGKERTEALVEMSCTMGRTPEHLKEVLIKMARLSPHESNGQPLKASDYLSILAQLENLLGESEIKDHALLSILSMMKESNDG